MCAFVCVCMCTRVLRCTPSWETEMLVRGGAAATPAAAVCMCVRAHAQWVGSL